MKSRSSAVSARTRQSAAHGLLVTTMILTSLSLIGWRTSVALDSALLGFMAAVLTLVIGAAALSAVKPDRRAAY